MSLKAAEWLGAAVVGLLLAGALVYLFGSFFLMAAHVERRAGKRQVRER